MSKFFVLGVALLITSVSAHPIHISSQKAESPTICPMHSSPMSLDHQAMMVKDMVATGQDSDQDPGQNRPPGQGDQPDDTPSHRYSPGDGCSSVNPNAPNKERDGVNSNTVGCKCTKKCVNGQTQEDRSKDEKGVYICKNACNEKRCTCPDPCKS